MLLRRCGKILITAQSIVDHIQIQDGASLLPLPGVELVGFLGIGGVAEWKGFIGEKTVAMPGLISARDVKDLRHGQTILMEQRDSILRGR